MSTCSWTRLHVLGRGSSATVYLAADRQSGQLFAVKSVELESSELLQREQRILSLLNCPRVVSYIGHDITVENGSSFYNLLLEYVPRTLSEAIYGHGGRLEESVIRTCTREILCGLAHVHFRGLAHCDIKGQNILMGPDGAKLADLGCAKWVSQRPPQVSGTPLYMAPEVARGEEQGQPCDVWAVGCTVIEMATGRPPWTDVIDPVSALHRIGHCIEGPELPRELSDQGRDFLSKCFRRCPTERWTVDQLLKHPFVDESICGQKQMDFGSVFSYSPKSTLDHGFWGSVEEAQVHQDQTHVGSPAERIRMLIGSNSSTAISGWAMDSEESWICVRRNEDEMSVGPVSVNESIVEGPGSWALISEETSDRIQLDTCIGACKCHESNWTCGVNLITSDLFLCFVQLMAVGNFYN